jgi:hypothetical protein
VAFLDEAPPVDARFWNEIEAAMRNQPMLAPSPWES